MYTIKFSNRYKKMPEHIEHLQTWVTRVSTIEYKDLTPDEIKLDTETVKGTFFPLPQGKLISIELWTDTIHGGRVWRTLRSYTQEKYDFYKLQQGQQVGIEIKNTA